MNISSAVNYPSSGTSSYYPKNTVSTESQSDTATTAGMEDPQLQAEKAKEQKARDRKVEDQKNQDKQAEEQKLQKQAHYKKEDRIKETKQKDSDQFLQNQQQQIEESSEIASDMLAQNAYIQMGARLICRSPKTITRKPSSIWPPVVSRSSWKKTNSASRPDCISSNWKSAKNRIINM